MAKAIGLIGNLKGKIGNTVFATRRGTQIARVYQPEVHNPKSTRQRLSRDKMKLAVATLKPFAAQILKAGWSRNYPTYEFQHAVGAAIPVDAGIISGTGSYEDLSVDFGPLADVLSAHNIPAPSVSTLDFTSSGKVKFSVSLPEGDYFGDGGEAIGAGVVIAVWSPDLGQVVTHYAKISTPNSQAPMTVDIPSTWLGVTAHVYVFAKQVPVAVNGIEDGTEPWKFPAKTSAAIYAGNGVIA